jgi:hypothetical protein
LNSHIISFVEIFQNNILDFDIFKLLTSAMHSQYFGRFRVQLTLFSSNGFSDEKITIKLKRWFGKLEFEVLEKKPAHL